MKVLIADDHALFRQSLRLLLESRGVEVVGEAQDGQEALEQARKLKPDVVFMDLAMPGLDGLTATRLITIELPKTMVVVLTASEEDSQLYEAIKSGAQGYLLKNIDSNEFFELLERAGRGEPALPPSMARKVLQEFAQPSQAVPEARGGTDALTVREQEVLSCLARGVTSNRGLARELGVSEHTVQFHVRNILEKLHLNNRAEVVSFAYRHGIVGPA